MADFSPWEINCESVTQVAGVRSLCLVVGMELVPMSPALGEMVLYRVGPLHWDSDIWAPLLPLWPQQASEFSET